MESWSVKNDTARNVIIFGVDNGSSSHADNRKNNFLVIEEGATYGINGSYGSPEKKISINFSRKNTEFCVSLDYNADNSYLFVNGKEIFKFEADNKNVNFPTQFCLERISSGFSEFFMFHQIFLSPQVKRSTIIINYKHDVYELSHELPNKLRLEILGN